MNFKAAASLLIVGGLLTLCQHSFAFQPLEIRLWEQGAPGSEGADAVVETVEERGTAAFLVSTYDDRVKAENSLVYFKALRTAKVPAELHIYEVGGHGYGIIPTDKPVTTWHHRLGEWMKQRGLLDM